MALAVEDPKALQVSAFWCKTIFQKEKLALMPQPIFSAVHLLNEPYLKHLSGQKLWNQRLQIYNGIVADRHWIVSALAESPTVPGSLPGPASCTGTQIDLEEAEAAELASDGHGVEEGCAVEGGVAVGEGSNQNPGIFSAPLNGDAMASTSAVADPAATARPGKKRKPVPKPAAGGGRLVIARPKATVRSAAAAKESETEEAMS